LLRQRVDQAPPESCRLGPHASDSGLVFGPTKGPGRIIIIIVIVMIEGGHGISGIRSRIRANCCELQRGCVHSWQQGAWRGWWRVERVADGRAVIGQPCPCVTFHPK
jgi:hypothetical protein